MISRHLVLAALSAICCAGTAAAADPEYTNIQMEIDIDASADDVWATVGGFCDVSKFLPVDCVITSGDGEMGTVRVLAEGRVTEVLVAKTNLSYGYTFPLQEGQFYNLYHGFMEARPVTANTSKVIYTLVYDSSNLEDQAAKDADIARRRDMFEGALANIKELVED